MTEAEKEVLRHKATNAFLIAAREEAVGEVKINWEDRCRRVEAQAARDSRRADSAELVARLANALFWFQDSSPLDHDGGNIFRSDERIIALLRNAYVLALEDFEEEKWHDGAWRSPQLSICTCERDKKEEAEAKCSCS